MTYFFSHSINNISIFNSVAFFTFIYSKNIFITYYIDTNIYYHLWYYYTIKIILILKISQLKAKVLFSNYIS